MGWNAQNRMLLLLTSRMRVARREATALAEESRIATRAYAGTTAAVQDQTKQIEQLLKAAAEGSDDMLAKLVARFVDLQVLLTKNKLLFHLFPGAQGNLPGQLDTLRTMIQQLVGIAKGKDLVKALEEFVELMKSKGGGASWEDRARMHGDAWKKFLAEMEQAAKRGNL